MTSMTAPASPQLPVAYRDQKRYLWLASLFYPLVALSGIGLYELSGSEWALLAPVVSIYGGVSLLDWLLGEDRSNPPEAAVAELEADALLPVAADLTVPMHFLVLIVIAVFAATSGVSLGGVLVLALTAGLYSGLGINTAHEFGHKKTLLERRMARIVLAVPAYGHFCVEHNRGHHRYVATSDDPASSRMGESIYRFAAARDPRRVPPRLGRRARAAGAPREASPGTPTTRCCSPTRCRRCCSSRCSPRSAGS